MVHPPELLQVYVECDPGQGRWPEAGHWSFRSHPGTAAIRDELDIFLANPALDSCYSAAAQGYSSAEIRFEVLPSGRVDRVTGGGNSEFATCLREKLRDWSFDPGLSDWAGGDRVTLWENLQVPTLNQGDPPLAEVLSEVGAGRVADQKRNALAAEGARYRYSLDDRSLRWLRAVVADQDLADQLWARRYPLFAPAVGGGRRLR